MENNEILALCQKYGVRVNITDDDIINKKKLCNKEDLLRKLCAAILRENNNINLLLNLSDVEIDILSMFGVCFELKLEEFKKIKNKNLKIFKHKYLPKTKIIEWLNNEGVNL